MDKAEQVNAVVDKLAEKLSGGADQLKLLGGTVIEETARWGFGQICFGVLLGALILWGSIWAMTKLAKAATSGGADEEASGGLSVVVIILGVVGMGFSLATIWDGVRAWAAPTLTVLETVLGK